MTREIVKSIVAAVLAVAACGCEQMNPEDIPSTREISFTPATADVMTRGYSETDAFYETGIAYLHSATKPDPAARTMQISSYLHPQNGAEGGYFFNKTFSFANDPEGRLWWNTNTVGGTHDPIFWPVGGTLDFLAYSVSDTDSKGVVAEWDESNAASKLTLTIPGENSQNDILFAGACGVCANSTSSAVDLDFRHAQAWLEFELTGVTGISLTKIVIEDAYNAGTLTIRNGNGDATATWSFTSELRKDITFDNNYGVHELNGTAQYMDMLIPQQAKTSFSLYYVDSTVPGVPQTEHKVTIDTDKKTWLMGERYIYKINISPSEVTVAPEE